MINAALEQTSEKTLWEAEEVFQLGELRASLK